MVLDVDQLYAVMYNVKCVRVPSPIGNLLSVGNWLIPSQEGLLHALDWPVGGRKWLWLVCKVGVMSHGFLRELGNFWNTKQDISKIQQDATDAGIYLLHSYSTWFGCLSHPSSGVRQTVTAASGTGHSIRAWYYDLYQKLLLQFDVLLMMGAMDTRNM